jgi:hypothetical protein
LHSGWTGGIPRFCGHNLDILNLEMIIIPGVMLYQGILHNGMERYNIMMKIANVCIVKTAR